MVKGLELFKEAFSDHTEQYVLIGGTACFVLFEEAGLEFRPTRDLDIVLCLEALSEDFIKGLFDFIRLGKYQTKLKSSGKKIFYRFEKPDDTSYPDMIELFSGKPVGILIPEEARYAPVLLADEAVSLSAILLDTDYNQLILNGKTVINGMSVLRAEYLLILKAKAWLDLSERKARGEKVDSARIKIQLNDVFRLYRLLIPGTRIILPDSIRADLSMFVTKYQENPLDDISRLGITSNQKEVLDVTKLIFGL